MERVLKYNNGYLFFKLITYSLLLISILAIYNYPSYFNTEIFSISMDNKFQFYSNYKKGKVKSLKIDFCTETCNKELEFEASCIRECLSRSKSLKNARIYGISLASDTVCNFGFCSCVFEF